MVHIACPTGSRADPSLVFWVAYCRGTGCNLWQPQNSLLASVLPGTSRRLKHKACAGVEPAVLKELATQLEVVRRARTPLCPRSRSPFSAEAMTDSFLAAFLVGSQPRKITGHTTPPKRRGHISPKLVVTLQITGPDLQMQSRKNSNISNNSGITQHQATTARSVPSSCIQEGTLSPIDARACTQKVRGSNNSCKKKQRHMASSCMAHPSQRPIPTFCSRTEKTQARHSKPQWSIDHTNRDNDDNRKNSTCSGHNMYVRSRPAVQTCCARGRRHLHATGTQSTIATTVPMPTKRHRQQQKQQLKQSAQNELTVVFFFKNT